MKKLTFCVAVIFIAQLSFSQAFIAATTTVPMNTEAIVTTVDGEVITGKIRTSFLSNGHLKSFRLKDADKNIHKFKSIDVVSVKVKPGVLGKLDMIVDKTSSLKEIIKTDFEEIIDREWIYYERVISPKNNKKPLLLQKLNPGFDEAIKIYNNPSAGETGTFSSGDMVISGGENRSYIAVKNNGESFYIRKGRYNKIMDEHLGHCKAFTGQFGTKKLKFKDIALHIFYYNQQCR